ncbi:hypothetical protein GCM10023116_28890 [Kistimonas scapharcae]|uniref:Uncharacterized protein n=1 Tax=Kistimonas scapharcae TaxID=1036133 RepID=A0ABP8V3V3_9GAMM
MDNENLDPDKLDKALLSEIDQLINQGAEVFTRYQALLQDINMTPDDVQRDIENPDFPKFAMAETIAWKNELDADVKRKIKEASKEVKNTGRTGKSGGKGGSVKKSGLI